MFLFVLGSRGQQWAVMKLLQAGVIAVVMLTIVWGVVQHAKDQTPQSDIYSVTCEMLGDAYAARDTGEHFTREALLVEQELNSIALIQCSGLPSGVRLKLLCEQSFCLYEGKPLDRSNNCREHSPCTSMEFVSGQTTDICAICYEDGPTDVCDIWFGESTC